jgi:hypothetical protein
MQVNISPHPFGALPEKGEPFVVVPAEEGVDPLEIYRKHSTAPLRCVARRPMLAILRTPLLATPDRVNVVAASWTAEVLALELEIRRFTGHLAANDPWTALVSVELGTLEPGSYKVSVRTTSLHFAELQRPETAANPIENVQDFRFECT